MRTHIVRNAKRGLGLCGYGNFEFSDMAIDLAYIHKVFQNASIGAMQPQYTPEFRGHYMLSAANRYFTPKKLVKFETYRPYSDVEDPFGALHLCAEQCNSSEETAVVRVQENDILFFKKETGINNKGAK